MRKGVLAVLVLCFTLFSGLAWGDDSAVEKKGVLMVSFGTTVPSGQRAIDNLHSTLKSSCPGVEVRLAYTSNIIRRKLAKEGVDIDSPMIALSKMRDEGFTDVVVVSTHIIPGEEYCDLQAVVDGFRSIEGKYGFDRLVLSEPLLYKEEDFKAMAGFLSRTYGSKVDEDSAVALMGHGSPHFANSAYGQLQVVLDDLAPGFIVGTVEGTPELDDVVSRLNHRKGRKVTLVPFMMVAGDHATNDMAGPEDDSWSTVLKGEGFRVSSVLKGLGEYDEIGAMVVRKFRSVAGKGF
ncbi:sirohydrochlorin cobaltochelatase [Dethiosulfovibrio salsuginis]|uniref:sirohydrochlorin cobaltochelatase n=1 Tax=Dethiosulfovibrio salsuginis TaxID=561720 RepID=UPI000A1CCD0B|nr:sirohydrochlorin cobaltochelatase [Dethiosulfovibrio salsuginis]